MKEQWIEMEHYRMHRIEEWPDGPQKESALNAVRSAIAALSRTPRNAPPLKRPPTLLEMPLGRAA